MKSTARTAAALAVAAATLLGASACGSPTPEGNGKKFVDLMIEGKKDDALKMLDDTEAKRVGDRSPSSILIDRSSFPGKCKSGDPSKGDRTGTPAVVVPLSCDGGSFKVYLKTPGGSDQFTSVSYDRV